MALELRHVCLRLGGQSIVEDVSFALAEGDIGCLLGPSGAGKTSLLRAIAGLEPIDRGEIVSGAHTLSGADLHCPPEARGIGMLFQDLALLGHLDATANVMLGLHRLPRRERATTAEAWLARVGLAGRGRHYPHQLSGGQQQRVALARALAPQPKLLLLDEPFSSLDASLRDELALEIRSLLKAVGTTALMVSHSQNEAFAFADRIGVMQAGRLLQWDRGYRLYHQPASRAVADFVGEGVLLRARRQDNRISMSLGQVHHSGRSGRVDVLLRPDDVIHDDDSPVQAEVLERWFRGAEFLYRLRLDSGETVLSLVPSHHDHAIGSRIGVRLELEHVIAFDVDD